MLETKPASTVLPVKLKPATKSRFSLLELLKLSFRANRLLTLFGLMMIFSIGACITGLLIDHRTLLGVPIWDKPIKFSISLALYGFSLIWILSFLKGHPRVVAIVSTITSLAFLAEMVIIVIQVFRGMSSHFNVATAFDGALFGIMGMLITIFWFANFVAAIYLLFQRFDDPAFAWSVRLALILTLAGAALGFLMTTQHTPEQQLALDLHQKLTSNGGHSVGVNDGGPGLPFVGWSTVGGDLRIPHFVGLHALQIIPLLGWFILRYTRLGFSKLHRVALVWLAGLGYAGLIALLTWQALRGQSIIAPDALTLGGFAVLVGGVGLIGGGIIWHARNQDRKMETYK